MDFDPTKRAKLLEKLESPSAGQRIDLPLASLEDFFDGCDEWCIASNVGIPASEFRRVLQAIRERPTVEDVLIAVLETDDDEWPYSDRVYVLSQCPIVEISGWLAPLQPDAISEGWAYEAPPNAPVLQAGTHVYSVWWD